MSVYALSTLEDTQQIRGFLLTDRHYAAYAIGDLDPRYRQHTRWLSAARSGEIEGLALLYNRIEPTVLFLMGSMEAQSALLMHGIGPARVFFTAKTELESILRAFYQVEFLHRMYRLIVTRGTYIAPAVSGAPREVVRLAERHVVSIQMLQKEVAGYDSRPTEDVAFNGEMLADGYYFGIFDADRLIAVAGTHLAASKERIAAIGNVVVSPDHRRQGLGLQVSSAVTEALLDNGYEHIVLNVRTNNNPAIKTYRRLGFRQVGDFIEGVASRTQ